ncbi:MAG: hypothetical protein CL577_08445 [Alteromonadaceae bacterium]|jgi:hypothetical protein|uniref:DUF2960 domain-containing protein n=1 Tax=Rheinheimera aquimaris TaxID=412437 RepID=A0ABN1DH86_9GAMM|nr:MULTISPECIES: DUF2960 domain-containing protein [Rheinheimera]MBJ92612.1 hypothetical protein [Alteromonadaceae bacterium]MCB5211982.1 DUF2960 domain-containing protein [Rheinheimera aquimaris]MCD1600091.1 DUF2960 domain-containing protein [Rheinheimera aquimaris]HBN89509.1 DUF2960 domain-containing protein [Rheinheimera sp.]|tara:strand:- start:12115 stop:12360 length:246 start_codon:yes stop_codon:yes gene_type:complete
MARQISYTFKNQHKIINFSYDKYRDMYEAVAAAEGIDLRAFLAMEQQVAMTAKRGAAVKNYRQQEFARMGFANIAFVRDEH